jgi:hypothetical protein
VRLVFLLAIVSLGCGRTGAGRIAWDGGSHEPLDQAQAVAQETAPAVDLGGGSDGSEVVPDGPSCGATVALTRDVPVIEILVDTSEPMGVLVPATGQSRWELTRDALKQVISSLTSASPAVGLTFFPHPDDCSLSPPSVPAVPITEQSRAQLLSALDSVSVPAGARSTTAAFALAQADVTGKVFPNGLVLSPAIMVLLTAGAPDPSPSCGPPGDPALGLKSQARTAFAAGQPTCVFALPGAGDARDLLVDVARLGAGVSDSPDAAPPAYCFQDCEQAADPASCLSTGIRCILDLGVPAGDKCDIAIPSSPQSCFVPLSTLPDFVDLDTAQVSVTTGTSLPRVVPRVDCQSAQADGWDFDRESAGKTLILCGQSCSDFMGAWSYTITFGCKEG